MNFFSSFITKQNLSPIWAFAPTATPRHRLPPRRCGLSKSFVPVCSAVRLPPPRSLYLLCPSLSCYFHLFVSDLIDALHRGRARVTKPTRHSPAYALGGFVKDNVTFIRFVFGASQEPSSTAPPLATVEATILKTGTSGRRIHRISTPRPADLVLDPSA